MKVVKICGIKTVEAASVAIDNGANLLGCILVPNRARTIDLEVAKQIARMVKRDRTHRQSLRVVPQHNTLNRLHNGLLRMGRF